MKPDDRKVLTSLSMPPKLKKELDKGAKEANRNFSNYVCDILERALNFKA